LGDYSCQKRQQSVAVSGNYVAVSENNVAVSGNFVAVFGDYSFGNSFRQLCCQCGQALTQIVHLIIVTAAPTVITAICQPSNKLLKCIESVFQSKCSQDAILRAKYAELPKRITAAFKSIQKSYVKDIMAQCAAK